MSETRKYLTKEDVLRELDFEIKQAENFRREHQRWYFG